MTHTNGDLKPGDMQTASMWFVTPDQKENAKPYIQAAFDRDRDAFGVTFDRVTFAVMSPELAPPPVELGARILVGEARVLSFQPHNMAEAIFMMELDPRDLDRLRRITQTEHRKLNPQTILTVDQLDRMVAHIGPELGERLLQEIVAGHA